MFIYIYNYRPFLEIIYLYVQYNFLVKLKNEIHEDKISYKLQFSSVSTIDTRTILKNFHI